MGVLNSIADLGKFKENISAALFKSEDIQELLLGDTTGMTSSQKLKQFKEHVKSHLFVDDTIEETASFIFYDVVMPHIAPQVKTVQIWVYCVCHRDILDNYYKDGYHGNRVDILCEMVENALINNKEVAKQFGIGQLQLKSLEIYNSRRHYGRSLLLEVPNFR